MPSSSTRTPAQWVADLGAQVKRAIITASMSCDPAWRSLTAAALGKSRQRIDDVCDLGDDAQLSVRDLLAYPEPIRHALAQLVVGEGHCIASVPEAVETPDDLALLSRLVRESNAAVEALMSAIADGRISADEGAKIVDACQRSLAVTATVRQLGERAVKARLLGVRLRAVSP